MYQVKPLGQANLALLWYFTFNSYLKNIHKDHYSAVLFYSSLKVHFFKTQVTFQIYFIKHFFLILKYYGNKRMRVICRKDKNIAT